MHNLVFLKSIAVSFIFYKDGKRHALLSRLLAMYLGTGGPLVAGPSYHHPSLATHHTPHTTGS